MFHIVPGGGRMSAGLNILTTPKGRPYGVSIGTGRSYALFDWEMLRGWIWIDRSHDHSMYRPNDMDSWTLVCRRCSKTVNKVEIQSKTEDAVQDLLDVDAPSVIPAFCEGSKSDWRWGFCLRKAKIIT
jgi:hypothetical protein